MNTVKRRKRKGKNNYILTSHTAKLYSPPGRAGIKKKVYGFDVNTKELIKEFASVAEATEELKIHDVVTYVRSQKQINGMYLSYENYINVF